MTLADMSLSGQLRSAGMEPLGDARVGMFETYLQLILKWNARMNLTAVRDPASIVARHFVECIACARALPAGAKSVLDFGSGAGLPGIPIAICRSDLSVTLAESQAKKAAFLNEVVRALDLKATVFAGRAETTGSTFDCVVLRAVDRMSSAVKAAGLLTSHDGWLLIMITKEDCGEMIDAAGPGFTWEQPLPLPRSENGVFLLGRRAGVFHVEHA